MTMRKLYKNLSLTAFLALFVASFALGQERTVTGTVSDETGSTMPGVNVLVKGSSMGTATDANGQYRLAVSSDQAVLVFSFIGYTTQEVAVGSQSNINISLALDVQTLTELVVTGYSIDKRRELTGSVSTVKQRDLTFAPTGNVEQMLQGRVPGVTVITNGQPGTTSQIRVRGFGAFGGNSPLYVVDGVPVADVSFLNPDDIETTTVLKDAASASIYGARAASGVIVYTTKKGRKGQKLNVTYDNMFGVTTPGEGQPMMNPNDFMDWTWRAQRNTEDVNAREFVDPDTQVVGRPVDYATAFETFNHPQFGGGLTPRMPDYLRVGDNSGIVGTVNLDAERLNYNVDPRNGASYQVIRANKEGTDWYDEITKTAPIFRQTLGFNGGGDAHRFYLGLSQNEIESILLSQSFKRYTMRLNTEFDVLKNLRIGENMQFTYISRLGIGGGSGGQGVAADENDVLSAFRMPSIIPVYDEFGGYAGTIAKGFNNPRNPVASRDGQRDNKAARTEAFGNVYAEWDIIPGLTARTSAGLSYWYGFSRSYNRWQYENSENNSSFGYGQNQDFRFGWTFTNTLAYKKTFGDNSLDVLVGQEALNTGKGWTDSQSGQNPFSWDPNFINMTNVDSRQANGSYTAGVNFASLFGNVKYAFREKYIVGFVLRRDGSSRFGAENRYGVFPAISAAWRISSESFMQSIPAITDLKIRGGYGTMGNSNNVDPNNQFFLFGGDLGASAYDIGGTNNSAQVGYYRSRIGNPAAKWETSVTKNIGLDGLLFDGKLDIVLDIWQKDTKDLLLAVPLSSTAGVNAAAPSINVGKMTNKGIDIAITTKGNMTSDLKYEVTLNGSFLDNKIVELSSGQTYLTTVNPGFRGITPIRNQLNQSISSFFGYKVAGIFQDQEEVTGSPAQSGKAIGRFRYEDLNGDNTINDEDRTWLGSPVPKFTGGLNFIIRYAGFDLEAYTYVSLGGKIFNVSKWFTDFYPSFQGASISERVKESWSTENRDATIPIFESASNFSTNTQSSSFYVENGSYLRMQNLTLGYNFPVAIQDKLKMNKLRVFVSTNNLFTISPYEGLDPSVGGAADTNFGIDVGNFPVTRQFTAGINLGF
jgi:TonB-linked SusC/RagA family outer membrane protein